MSKKLLALMIVFGMMLTGCINMIPTPVPTPTPPPLPEPVEGVDYIEGEAEVPEGKYLLVEFKTEVHMCLFETVNRDFPTYEYEDGTLSGFVSYPDGYVPDDPIIGYFGRYTSDPGGGPINVASYLFAFQSLPFQHPFGTPATVLSIDSEGTIVADVNDDVVELKVGESWSYTSLGEACDRGGNVKYMHRFINQGFLTQDQIDLHFRD